jgi:zinc transport system substrate-binding protein
MIKMKIRSLPLLCTFVFSLSLLCGCVSSTPADSSDLVSGQEKLTVVTSFYPIFISTINVTGAISSVEVVNMTSAQTGCLHDYQLTPQNLEILEKADVFIINGAGMESFLDDVIAQLPDLVVIDASAGIETIPDENGEPNPHVWVSITNTMVQVRNIADGLALRDTANAMSYKQNSSLYLARLSTLRTETKDALTSIKTRDIITFHEAFPYFAKEFGLDIIAVIEREPNSTPTAKELEETIRIINGSSSKVIFVEPQYSSSVAETIANETGAKIFTLDPIVTGDATSAAMDAYITKMTENVAVLKEALE